MCFIFFRFLDEDRLNGRCEITDLPTKWNKFSTWETSVTPLFNVYVKHSYCPEARFKISSSLTATTAVAVASASTSLLSSNASGRILTPSPVLGKTDFIYLKNCNAVEAYQAIHTRCFDLIDLNMWLHESFCSCYPGVPLDLYPPGSYYLLNNIFPDSRKKYAAKTRGEWLFYIVAFPRLDHNSP